MPVKRERPTTARRPPPKLPTNQVEAKVVPKSEVMLQQQQAAQAGREMCSS